MDFTKEIGLVLFDGYWKGGANGDPKARQGKSEPKSYDEAVQQFPYLLGKIRSTVVMTDYDNPEAFQARLRIAEALQQHCIALTSALLWMPWVSAVSPIPSVRKKWKQSRRTRQIPARWAL